MTFFTDKGSALLGTFGRRGITMNNDAGRIRGAADLDTTVDAPSFSDGLLSQGDLSPQPAGGAHRAR
jgi:hypothetical protein